MRIPIEEKNWFSPARIKMATSCGHGLPVVKVPGSNQCPWGQRANEILGVSITSNRLEDRLKSEVMDCFQEIENVPTSGFEIVEVSHWSATGENDSPFFKRFHTTRKTLVRDPRGFVVGISHRSYEDTFKLLEMSKLPGEYVYAWPSSLDDVEDGPWLVPAGSKIARRARAFSEALEAKTAFKKVRDMEVLGVYTAATGKFNGRKMAFLGLVPFVKASAQAKAVCCQKKDGDGFKPTPKRALFVMVDSTYPSLHAIPEETASKTFSETAPEKIPERILPDIARVARSASRCLEANPVDPRVAADSSVWEEFDPENFATRIGWEKTKNSYKIPKALSVGRAAKLPGKPNVQVVYSVVHAAGGMAVQATVRTTSVRKSKFGNYLEHEKNEVYSASAALESGYGMVELAKLLEKAKAELGLEQPKLGTLRKPSPVQTAWWTVYRMVSDQKLSQIDFWDIANQAGRHCYWALCTQKQ